MAKPFCETCESTAFLNPELFVTPQDTPNRKEWQYAKGLETGKKASHISISYTGVWGALLKDGGDLSGYEKIGYHANTADLLRGFIDSGCEIHVYRFDRPATRIK